MRLPRFLLRRLAGRLIVGVGCKRDPDVVIGGVERPYLERWWVIPRNRFCNLYLHLFLRDDDDRALHDHPWVNCSILLVGSYIEHTIPAGGVHRKVIRHAGDVVVRGPKAAHRIELPADGETCWTLFLTGPVVRSWGFHCPQGWRHWRDFTAKEDPGQIGRGCD
jgi:hypothetical protein